MALLKGSTGCVVGWHDFVKGLSRLCCNVDVVLLKGWHGFVIGLTWLCCMVDVVLLRVDVVLLKGWRGFVKGLMWLCCKVDLVLLKGWRCFVASPHPPKVKSTPSPRPKTRVWQQKWKHYHGTHCIYGVCLILKLIQNWLQNLLTLFCSVTIHIILFQTQISDISPQSEQNSSPESLPIFVKLCYIYGI